MIENKKVPLVRYVSIFFLIIAVVQGSILYLSITSDSGLIASQPYEEGLQYQNVINQLTNFKKLGWKTEVNVESGGGLIELIISDKEGSPVLDVDFIASLRRLAGDSADVLLQFKQIEGGIYQADVSLLPRGLWELSLRVNRDAQVGLHQERLVF